MLVKTILYLLVFVSIFLVKNLYFCECIKITQWENSGKTGLGLVKFIFFDYFNFNDILYITIFI